MSQLPRITIVTPSFNQAPYLEQTLRSVLDQGYSHLEYIVMDGGSTDGSVQIIEKYADRLTHWQTGPDNGQADAIHRGFELATGEILAWLNSDDILLPNALNLIAQWFVEHRDAEWLVGGTLLIDRHGCLIRDRWGLPIYHPGTRVSCRRLLHYDCGFHQPSSFWRRSAFWAVGGLDTSLRFSFDYDMFLRLARRSSSGHLAWPLSGFRIHPASKTSTMDDVRRAENEVLWCRHGRYACNWLSRGCMSAFYAARARLRRYATRALWLARLYRPPTEVNWSELDVPTFGPEQASTLSSETGMSC